MIKERLCMLIPSHDNPIKKTIGQAEEVDQIGEEEVTKVLDTTR